MNALLELTWRGVLMTAVVAARDRLFAARSAGTTVAFLPEIPSDSLVIEESHLTYGFLKEGPGDFAANAQGPSTVIGEVAGPSARDTRSG